MIDEYVKSVKIKIDKSELDNAIDAFNDFHFLAAFSPEEQTKMKQEFSHIQSQLLAIKKNQRANC